MLGMPAVVPWAALSQNCNTGQTVHSGLAFWQTVAPSSIIAWLWSPGVWVLSIASAVGVKALTASLLFLKARASLVRRARIRTTLPSTTAAGKFCAIELIAAEV